MNEQVTYTISELANEFDVSTRTIRYYEEVGFLHPGRKGDSNQRIYTRKDRGRLKLILRGKRFGFSLKEINEMINLYEVDPDQKEQLKKAIEYGDKRVAELDEMIEELKLIKKEILDFREKFMLILEDTQ